MSIELSTFIRDVSGSGSPETSLSKVCSVHTTVPDGGFRSCALDRLLLLAAAFFLAFSLAMTCSGACTTTKPAES